jgi:hypothetical protein
VERQEAAEEVDHEPEVLLPVGEEAGGDLRLVEGCLELGDLVGSAREEEVRRQIVEALSSCRTPQGGYRLENEFHVLVASP